MHHASLPALPVAKHLHRCYVWDNTTRSTQTKGRSLASSVTRNLSTNNRCKNMNERTPMKNHSSVPNVKRDFKIRRAWKDTSCGTRVQNPTPALIAIELSWEVIAWGNMFSNHTQMPCKNQNQTWGLKMTVWYENSKWHVLVSRGLYVTIKSNNLIKTRWKHPVFNRVRKFRKILKTKM